MLLLFLDLALYTVINTISHFTYPATVSRWAHTHMCLYPGEMHLTLCSHTHAWVKPCQHPSLLAALPLAHRHIKRVICQAPWLCHVIMWQQSEDFAPDNDLFSGGCSHAPLPFIHASSEAVESILLRAGPWSPAQRFVLHRETLALGHTCTYMF